MEIGISVDVATRLCPYKSIAAPKYSMEGSTVDTVAAASRSRHGRISDDTGTGAQELHDYALQMPFTLPHVRASLTKAMMNRA